MSSLAIDNIGLLVTNDPALGEGSLGVIRDAALVFEGGRVAAVQRAGAAADRSFDAGGRCVIPQWPGARPLRAVAASSRTEARARAAGIELVGLDTDQALDLAVDGADEIGRASCRERV